MDLLVMLETGNSKTWDMWRSHLLLLSNLSLGHRLALEALREGRYPLSSSKNELWQDMWSCCATPQVRSQKKTSFSSPSWINSAFTGWHTNTKTDFSIKKKNLSSGRRHICERVKGLTTLKFRSKLTGVKSETNLAVITLHHWLILTIMISPLALRSSPSQ